MLHICLEHCYNMPHTYPHQDEPKIIKTYPNLLQYNILLMYAIFDIMDSFHWVSILYHLSPASDLHPVQNILLTIYIKVAGILKDIFLIFYYETKKFKYTYYLPS